MKHTRWLNKVLGLKWFTTLLMHMAVDQVPDHMPMNGATSWYVGFKYIPNDLILVVS